MRNRSQFPYRKATTPPGGVLGGFAGGWQLIAGNLAGTAAATLVWFAAAAALLASRFAMPVAAQWVLLTVGGVGVYLGAALLARYLLARAEAPAERIRPIVADTTTIRFALTSMLLGFAQFLVIYLATGVGVHSATVPGLIAVLIAALTIFAPYLCATGTSLPRALGASVRALGQPRHIGLAALCLIATAFSLMIPPLGLILMPWQTAALIVAYRRDPVMHAAAH